MRFPSRKGRGPQPDHWVDRPDVEAGTNDLRSRPVLIGRQPHHKHSLHARVHYAVPHQQPPGKPPNRIRQPHGCPPQTTPPPPGAPGTRVAAATARGKRPDPSRTRKLRPAAPMVLHPGGGGRVGHRRTTPRARAPPTTAGPAPL